MSAQPLVLATGNAHKVAECAALLAPHGFEVQGAPKGFTAIEDGDTFAANAAIKVRALASKLPPQAKSCWLLADDSGLVVPALGGAPGVHSARFAQGEPGHAEHADGANCRKLLRLLEGTRANDRKAYFVCVLALCRHGSTIETFEGVVHGHIAQGMAGAAGFGYDPLFVPEGHTESFAQLGAAHKQRLSHRARAVTALLTAVHQPPQQSPSF